MFNVCGKTTGQTHSQQVFVSRAPLVQPKPPNAVQTESDRTIGTSDLKKGEI